MYLQSVPAIGRKLISTGSVRIILSISQVAKFGLITTVQKTNPQALVGRSSLRCPQRARAHASKLKWIELSQTAWTKNILNVVISVTLFILYNVQQYLIGFSEVLLHPGYSAFTSKHVFSRFSLQKRVHYIQYKGTVFIICNSTHYTVLVHFIIGKSTLFEQMSSVEEIVVRCQVMWWIGQSARTVIFHAKTINC